MMIHCCLDCKYRAFQYGYLNNERVFVYYVCTCKASAFYGKMVFLDDCCASYIYTSCFSI